MLTLDLTRLRQEGGLPVAGSIPAGAELWEGSDLVFAEAVEVEGTAKPTGDGGVVVQGSWKARVQYDCGRCLEPLTLDIDSDLVVAYMPELEGEDSPDDEIRPIGHQQRTLELAEAIREEVILRVPRYYAPEEGDDGKCTECGRAVSEFTRSSDDQEMDPRWSVLRELKET